MTFCCANQIKNACNSKYIKYLSCICGDGRGTFAASEFLLSPLSMVYLIYGRHTLRHLNLTFYFLEKHMSVSCYRR